MSDHIYACGQAVVFTNKRFLGPSWTGTFIITKLLPSGGEEPRYEIRSMGEVYSRVVFEGELSVGFEKLHVTDL